VAVVQVTLAQAVKVAAETETQTVLQILAVAVETEIDLVEMVDLE
jgi:hypothetical protein